jgi:regulatory protein YycH of two-component signal transduction system YycFG
MIERLKTVVLTVLVFLSLIQTYFLIFGSPKVTPTNPTEYVDAEVSGTRSTIEDVVFPAELILHSGKQTHTVLYPNHIHYQEIMKLLKSRTFENIRRSPPFLIPEDWEAVRDQHLGLEVRFRGEVPFSVLKSVFQLKGDLPLETDPVSRIWIFVQKENQEVRTFFFTEYNMFEARADLNNQNVEQMVGFGELHGTYQAKNGIYFPDAPLEMTQYKIAIDSIPIDQLQKTLFVDPRSARNFRNQEGSDIYTDGKRGLQIDPDQRWMTYTDPVPVVSTRNDVRANLIAAIQFINQHGGWNGQFIAKTIPQVPAIGRQHFTFLQYYDSFPIVSNRINGFGQIRISVQNRVVSNYERSMITLDETTIERSLKTIAGGKALDDLFAAFPRRGNVVALTPAYLPVVLEGFIELIPVWAAEMRDGTFEILR